MANEISGLVGSGSGLVAYVGIAHEVVRNKGGWYEGNLAHYFRVMFFKAKNLRHPYHNLRHMIHVMLLCHDACFFYRNELSLRTRRNLLIAALFHDFNHSGKKGDDGENIAMAVEALAAHILPEDADFFAEIADLIRATQYPHLVPSATLSLPAQILRDADLCQSFSVAWIQQVIIGLAEEWKTEPINILKMQTHFHENLLKLSTDWARQKFTPNDFAAKIEEIEGWLEILQVVE